MIQAVVANLVAVCRCFPPFRNPTLHVPGKHIESSLDPETVEYRYPDFNLRRPRIIPSEANRRFSPVGPAKRSRIEIFQIGESNARYKVSPEIGSGVLRQRKRAGIGGCFTVCAMCRPTAVTVSVQMSGRFFR